MIEKFTLLRNYFHPLLFIACGVIVGWLFEAIILKRLRRWTSKLPWRGDDIIITGIRGLGFTWCALAGLYAALLNATLTPAVFASFQRILLILAIASGTVGAARVLAGFVRLYAHHLESVLPSSSLFTNLTRIVVYLIGALIIFDSLGISITPILSALGIGGLAVALALQDTLANLFAGLQVLLSRQIRQGDYVKLNTGEEGYVADITWRNATLRALPNNLIVVPNAKLSSAIVTNYYLPECELAVLVDLGVSYNSDLKKVEEVTTQVAKEVMTKVQGGIPAFEPFIRYHTFGDSSVNFSVILRGSEFTDQYLIKHEFIKRLHQRYAQEGIEIPFPIRTLALERELKERVLTKGNAS